MDETYEQFEERVLNKRAAHMYQVIKNKLDARDSLTLSEMTHKSSRKQVRGALIKDLIIRPRWLSSF
jgi:cohesin complex subunit SCC1